MTANLITATGQFDPQAIAARVNALWSAKQDFLSGYEGPTLRYWQENIWTGALETAWREASGEQTRWLLDNAKPALTVAERAQYDAHDAAQCRLPITAHALFRELTWAKQKIADAARERAFARKLTPAMRTRALALSAVVSPDFQIAA